MGPRETRTRKSVLPDTATTSRVGPRETRTPQSVVTEPTSHSVKRKIQVTEGTVAVPNSGRASVTAGPPSQHRTFSCPTCGPISTNRSLHIDNHHVPWWVSPGRICWHCRLECNTVLRLLRRHGHRDCLTAYHAGYKFWAEWMDTPLREVAGHFGLTSLTDLLTLMRQQQWYPEKEVYTVQITFIFIDFRVCDFPAFRVLNAFYFQTDFNLRFKRKRDVCLTCKCV